jgi:hypothetical protein
MDMVMPEMDGISAVKQIVAGDPNARIIMCTSMGQQALVVEAIQAGAKSFIDYGALGRVAPGLHTPRLARSTGGSVLLPPPLFGPAPVWRGRRRRTRELEELPVWADLILCRPRRDGQRIAHGRPTDGIAGRIMLDPQHLYAIAALVTAATPIVIRLIDSRSERRRRSRSPRRGEPE